MTGFDQYALVAEEVPYYHMVRSPHCGQVQLFSVLETFYFQFSLRRAQALVLWMLSKCKVQTQMQK